MSLRSKVKDLSLKNHTEITACRRHLHQHPELSFEEENTALFVSQKLTDWGIPHQTGIGGHGIVGLIRGKNIGDAVVALRGDMDALPILEMNDLPYKSKNPGVMHACGHDVHTSCLLGAAKILNDLKDKFSGTIKLIFQPAEERLPGGASLMIAEGVLDNPKPVSIFGQHVQPSLEAGKVGFRAGKYMASADEIYITVKGKGGHGAMPHECIDPVIIAANLLVNLQQVISRYSDPTTPSVLTFGKINSTGGSTNVIPNEVKIEGTFRTMDEAWRKEAHKRMTKIAEGIAQGMGGACDFNIVKGLPFLVNHEGLTARAREFATEYLGAQNVVELPIRMTAEDFAYFSQHIPACFYRLGTGNLEKGISSPIHTNTFDVDENCLIPGTGLMAWLALRELGNE